MGVFNKIFKNGAEENDNSEIIEEIKQEENDISEEYTKLLRNYSIRYLGGNVNDIGTQKRMIEKISEIVPAINIDSLSFQVQAIFERNNLGDVPMQQFHGQLGFEINRWLKETDLTDIIADIPNADINSIIGAWGALDFYSFIMKPEYKENIVSFKNILIKEIKNRGIEFKQEHLTEFEALQRQCCVLSKQEPESQQLKELKKKIGELLLEQEEIWVAYDEDFLDKYMFISFMSRLEIFTKEEYGLKAKAHFAEADEGNFKLKRIVKDDIKAFFETALYFGAVLFNLDNGTMTLELRIEDFVKYDNEWSLDRANRNVRFLLLRHIQGVQRFAKIKDIDKKENLKAIYSKILNDNMNIAMNTVINGIFYVLTAQPYIENTTCFSKDSFDKVQAVLKNNNITDENIMISPCDKTYKIVPSNTGLGRISYPDKGTMLIVFTDKAQAEIVRKDIIKKGGEAFNIMAMNFIEIIPHALQGDGIVIDMPEYGFLINKPLLENMDNQIKKQKAENPS